MRRPVLLLLALLAALLAPAPAHAVNPNADVGGPGAKWFSGGNWIQQYGMNCTILGGSYSEVMVSGIASYGGLDHVPKVGERYWTSLLVAVPGTPCGTGVSAIETSVKLPPNTQIDTSRNVRCYFLSRNATSTDQFKEVGYHELWDFNGQRGKICNPQVTNSAYVSGGYSAGWRPMANGMMMQFFVPVISTGQLKGAASSPADEFSWSTTSTGVFSNPGTSSVWANVLPPDGPPQAYFERPNPAQPYWDAGEANEQLRNKVELWANFAVRGYAGNVKYEIRRLDRSPAQLVWGPGFPGYDSFNGAVPAGLDLIQVLPGEGARGPNGGFSPVAFDPPTTPGGGEWNVPMEVTWTFTRASDGQPYSGQSFSAKSTFRTLAGPDGDGDGVTEWGGVDRCPTVKANTPDGCPPAVPADGDRDGVPDARDACPAQPAPGTLDGCPGSTLPGNEQPPPGGDVPPPAGGEQPAPPAGGGAPPAGGGTPQAGTPVAAMITLKGKTLTRSKLKRGLRVPVTCSAAGRARVTLTVTAKVARRLGLGRKPAQLGKGAAACTPGKGARPRLVLTKRAKTALQRRRGKLTATLTLQVTADGATPGGASRRVTVR